MPFYRARRHPESLGDLSIIESNLNEGQKVNFSRRRGRTQTLISNVLLYSSGMNTRYSNNAGERCKVTEVHQPQFFGPDIQDGERRYGSALRA